jgi:rare lipoprotein A
LKFKNIFFCTVLALCLHHITLAQKAVLGAQASGACSFYAAKFEGKKTYFGEKYLANSFTAAHRTLPYNTVLAVTNTKNNLTVYVRVTDRGPHSHKRLIDISLAAAKQLNLVNDGLGKVLVRVVGFDGQRMLNAKDPTQPNADMLNLQQ